MDLELDTTMVSALISIVVSIASTVVFNKYQIKHDVKTKLDEEFNEILKIAIEYPYLESIDFTRKWTSKYDKSNESALRYEVYCTLVFNFLEKFSKFYNYNLKKIQSELAVKEWVILHSKYWRDPTIPNENINTYNPDFLKLVEDCLTGMN